MSHVADMTRSDQDAPWWHPRHPTGPTLYGFFAGLVFAIAVPGLVAAVHGALDDGGAGWSAYPLLGLALLVPVALLPARRTRRFGLAMLLGMVSTVLVVVVVAALVLWVLVSLGG